MITLYWIVAAILAVPAGLWLGTVAANYANKDEAYDNVKS